MCHALHTPSVSPSSFIRICHCLPDPCHNSKPHTATVRMWQGLCATEPSRADPTTPIMLYLCARSRCLHQPQPCLSQHSTWSCGGLCQPPMAVCQICQSDLSQLQAALGQPFRLSCCGRYLRSGTNDMHAVPMCQACQHFCEIGQTDTAYVLV